VEEDYSSTFATIHENDTASINEEDGNEDIVETNSVSTELYLSEEESEDEDTHFSYVLLQELREK